MLATVNTRHATVDCDVHVTVLTFFLGTTPISRRVVPGTRDSAAAVAYVRHAMTWANDRKADCARFGLRMADWCVDIHETTLS
jgi:hypothetical protein